MGSRGLGGGGPVFLIAVPVPKSLPSASQKQRTGRPQGAWLRVCIGFSGTPADPTQAHRPKEG